ncbi:unnamed protein product [Linum trigynum]|uniref:Uncharacterized protein n=1 Tax=Linum trigynum TaxID=586398 RepID=A0AAV2EY76_9ROSI
MGGVAADPFRVDSPDVAFCARHVFLSGNRAQLGFESAHGLFLSPGRTPEKGNSVGAFTFYGLMQTSILWGQNI